MLDANFLEDLSRYVADHYIPADADLCACEEEAPEAAMLDALPVPQPVAEPAPASKRRRDESRERSAKSARQANNAVPHFPSLFSAAAKSESAREDRDEACAGGGALYGGMAMSSQAVVLPQDGSDLDRWLKLNQQASFCDMLFKHIDRKGLKDSDVYHKAGVDRRVFSKIRSNPDYHPSKSTALALCLALELGLDDTKDLLGRAGYSLSGSDRRDLVIMYCIDRAVFNLMKVNEALVYCDQEPLSVVA